MCCLEGKECGYGSALTSFSGAFEVKNGVEGRENGGVVVKIFFMEALRV
jgi:hypothetical protein